MRLSYFFFFETVLFLPSDFLAADDAIAAGGTVPPLPERRSSCQSFSV
jgi:hypothetical protein